MITFDEPKFTRAAALEVARENDPGAHLGIMRMARDACWHEWHTADSMTDRNRAQLGYRILEHILSENDVAAFNAMAKVSADYTKAIKTC